MSETMTIRKEMYLLQLQNRKMRKDISWEICKL